MANPYERMKNDLINEAEQGVYDDSDSPIISLFSDGVSDQIYDDKTIDEDIEEVEDDDYEDEYDKEYD